MTVAYRLALAACLLVGVSACEDAGETSSSFALPSGCLGKCDGTGAERPSELDLVELVVEEGGQRAMLAWQPAIDESKVVEYWVARGRPPATEANLVTRVPVGFSQVAVNLSAISDDYFVASVDAEGTILGVSESLRVQQTQRTEYRLPEPGPHGEAMAAHVWAPVDGQDHPLVVLLHGNHDTCTRGGTEFCASAARCDEMGGEVLDNAGGYAYLGRSLAAKGYVAVSIDANDLNCQFGMIEERAELIVEHIRQWHAWREQGGFPDGSDLPARLDLARIGLFGHSRGGEAAAVATGLLAQSSADFAIEELSVLSLAPTDNEEAAVEGASLLMVLPACDGDVLKLSGQDTWSRSAARARSHQLHQVVIPGANHNFFNRNWLHNDSSCPQDRQLERASHEAALSVLVNTWFDAQLAEGEMPEASRGLPDAFPRMDEWVGVATDLRWSHASPASLVIEAADSAQVAATNALGGKNEYVALSPEVLFSPARRILSLFWDVRSDDPTIRHELLGVDASEFAAFSFRVAAEAPDAVAEVPVGAVVRVRDSRGEVAELDLQDLGGLDAQPSSGDSLHVPRTIRVPVERLLEANPVLDWSSLAHFEIDVAARGERSGIWQYGDLELVP